jgi:hypothetical protein
MVSALQDLASGEVAQAFVDHMGGAAYLKEYEEVDSSWISLMSQLSTYLEQNVAYYVNAGVLGTEASKKRKLLSSARFPASTKVIYSFVSAGGYTPWSSTEDREVKQVVLHSFGHQWHAFKSDNKWFGTMNRSDLMTMYTTEDTSKYFWIPIGTDTEKGMAHPGRLAGALSACMFPTPGSAGTHFLISRSGDLYVFSDCNDVMNSCHDLSPTAISIALEEALYLENPVATIRQTATWLPTGSPPGTDGTLKYWDYSQQQYLALAVLLKKLQLAYPNLATRAHTSSTGEASADFVGYTMHGHIQGADPRYIDVSPHLQTEDDWTALFDLVDQQEQVTEDYVWLMQDSGYTSRLVWISTLVGTLQNLGRVELTKNMITTPPLVTLLGILRAHREFQNTNLSYRAKAATAESLNSIGNKKRAGMVRNTTRGTNTGESLPAPFERGNVGGVWDL